MTEYSITSDKMVLTVNGVVTAPSLWRYSPVKLARRDDPQTSKDAAVRASGRVQDTIDRCVVALKKHGPMIPTQISVMTGIHYSEIQRRGKPAEEGGFIIRGPDTKDGQTVWRAK